MQTCAFVIYLLLLAKIDSLKTLFEYHGAEHKVANAYEKLEKKNITVENVKNIQGFMQDVVETLSFIYLF